MQRDIAAPLIEVGGQNGDCVERRNDVERLTVYETAAKAIFVRANGLQAYYRTYHKGRVGSVEGSRKGDSEKLVWRASALAGGAAP